MIHYLRAKKKRWLEVLVDDVRVVATLSPQRLAVSRILSRARQRPARALHKHERCLPSPCARTVCEKYPGARQERMESRFSGGQDRGTVSAHVFQIEKSFRRIPALSQTHRPQKESRCRRSTPWLVLQAQIR